MIEIKGYITNLGKYNEGELVGKWVTFPIDEDELNKILAEIGCSHYEYNQYIDTGYEEFFFTDWDYSFSGVEFGEFESIDRVNKIVERLEDWDGEEEKFSAACEIWNFTEVLENSPCDYNLYSDIENEYDLGYYWVVDSGCYDLSGMGKLADYIDYESFGRDIHLETDGGFTDNGYIEYVG